LLDIVISTKFKKDFNKQKIKLDFNDLNEFYNIIRNLQNKTPLDLRYKDHSLSGKYNNFRDCHVKPDLVLIYTIKDNELILERINSHSELFK
jgi:mRNA interferase YafQ